MTSKKDFGEITRMCGRERIALTGQVDVKAPSPTDMLSERSTQKRSDDAGNAISATDEPRVDGPFLKRHRISADDLCPRENPSRAESSNRSSNNECHRSRCGAANEGTNFEQGEGG